QGAIYPTPVIGMLGLLKSVDTIMTAEFKQAGDIIILLGSSRGHIGGSEYLKLVHNKITGDAPQLSLDDEKKLQDLMLTLIEKEFIQSCHDLSEGGLAVSVAESCVFRADEERILGAKINIDTLLRKDFYLFGEDQSRVMVS